jgi:hypothetical protein
MSWFTSLGSLFLIETPLDYVRNGACHAAARPHFQIDMSAPGICNCLLHLMWRCIDRSEERTMRPVSAVVRLPLGLLEIAGDEFGLHAVQDGAVKEERSSFPSLRISRNLEALDSQVADTLEGDVRLPSTEDLGDTLQNKLIGGTNAREIGMKRDRDNEGIGEASGALQHGPSAARPPQDRYAIALAGGKINIVGEVAGTA